MLPDEFSDQAEFDIFFEKLGSGSADEVADEDSGGDDEEFEINEQVGHLINTRRIQTVETPT